MQFWAFPKLWFLCSDTSTRQSIELRYSELTHQLFQSPLYRQGQVLFGFPFFLSGPVPTSGKPMLPNAARPNSRESRQGARPWAEGRAKAAEPQTRREAQGARGWRPDHSGSPGRGGAGRRRRRRRRCLPPAQAARLAAHSCTSSRAPRRLPPTADSLAPQPRLPGAGRVTSPIHRARLPPPLAPAGRSS